MADDCKPSFGPGNLRRHSGGAKHSDYGMPSSYPSSGQRGDPASNRADRFANPSGYCGLNGLELNKPNWMREGYRHDAQHPMETSLTRRGAPLKRED